MKWLKIASIALLGLVLAVFALMGLLYATRGTPTTSVKAFGDRAGPPGVSDSMFVRTFEVLTQTQLFAGNSIKLLANGDGTYPPLYADMRAARRSLIVQLYYCKPGVVADSFKAILTEQARRGVQVRVLFDAFGSQSLTDGYIDSLKTAGIRVAQFRPFNWTSLHKAQNRSHVRVIIADDSVAYTGGFGLADYWLGDGHHKDQWRETNVSFTGPAVLQLQAAFAIAWAEATGELLTGRFFFGTVPPSQDSSANQLAGLLFAQPTLGSTPAERFLALSIAGAKKRLYITNAYFIPDDDQRRLLAAAVKRGVDVRVLTAGQETDLKSVRYAAHANYEELLRAGIRIYEFQPAMIHSKTMVVDGIWATAGSMNFDNRSTAFNDESNIVAHDTTFARAVETAFLDDLRFSHEFKLEQFRRRSIFQKILERGASVMAKLL